MAKVKKSGPKPDSLLKFLKNLGEEDQMHDDHGTVIIGRRDRKPQIPEEKEKKET